MTSKFELGKIVKHVVGTRKMVVVNISEENGDNGFEIGSFEEYELKDGFI